MIISGEVVKTSQLPKKTLALTDSLVALMSSPLETVTVPVSDFVSFVSTQIGGSLIEGVGSLNYLPKFTGTNTLGNSLIYDNGTNVGIGTTSPTDRLHIVDSANANIFARVTANGTNASAAWVAQNDQVDNVVYRVFGSGVTGTQMGISLVRSASLMANLGGTGSFLLGTFSSTDFILGTANTERARINTSGNFLIGTTVDAGYKLDVNGNVRIGSSIFGQGTTNTYYQIASSDYHHRFFTRTNVGAALERFTIEGGAVSGKAYFQNTNVGIGTTTPVHDFVVNGNTGISINASGATFPNIHRDSTDGGMLLRSWNGSVFSNSIKITPAGNVGIGTTSPTQKLHVKDTTNTIVNAEAGSSIYAGILQTVGSNTWRLIAQGSGASGRLDIKDESYGVTAMSFPVNSGNVGIGTTSPASSLHIQKNSSNFSTEAIKITGTPLSNVTDGTSATEGFGLYLSYNVSGNRQFVFADTVSGAGVRYVGTNLDGFNKITQLRADITIGTETNGAHISVPVSNTQFSVSNLNGSASKIVTEIKGAVSQSANYLNVSSSSGSGDIFSILSTGNVGIGTSSPASRLTVLNPSNTVAALIGGGTSTPGWIGIGTVNSGALPIIQGYNNAVNASNTISLNPSGGNVLIGTATDSSYKLDVNGTARIQGIFYASNPVASSYIADFGGTTNGMVFQNAGGVNRTQLKGFSSGIETIRLDVLGGAMFGSGTLEPSAQVTINSTTKGFLPPRMTTAEINAISTPATGLTVFNITLNTICFYNGTSWQKVTSTAM